MQTSPKEARGRYASGLECNKENVTATLVRQKERRELVADAESMQADLHGSHAVRKYAAPCIRGNLKHTHGPMCSKFLQARSTCVV